LTENGTKGSKHPKKSFGMSLAISIETFEDLMKRGMA